MLWSVAPIGTGFRSDGFQRQNVVGFTPARLQTLFIETPRLRARLSISAMTDCWFMRGMHNVHYCICQGQ